MTARARESRRCAGLKVWRSRSLEQNALAHARSYELQIAPVATSVNEGKMGNKIHSIQHTRLVEFQAAVLARPNLNQPQVPQNSSRSLDRRGKVPHGNGNA